MSKSKAVDKKRPIPSRPSRATPLGEGLFSPTALAALTKFAELFQLLQGLVPAVQPPATDRPAGPTSPFSAQDFVDALLDRAFWPLPKKGNSEKKIPAETWP